MRMNEQTKLICPRLAGFYEAMLPVAGTLLRIVIGIMFLMHVSVKFNIGAGAVTAIRLCPARRASSS
jgi:hypothetical protein